MGEDILIGLGVVSEDTMGPQDETCEDVYLLAGTGSILKYPEECF